MRRAARVDSNQALIIEAFRALGCRVLPLFRVGGDCPDILIDVPGHGLALVEVKDGSKPPSKRKLSNGQAEFAQVWSNVFKVETIEQAHKLVVTLRKGEN
jgi:hypothetical protein